MANKRKKTVTGLTNAQVPGSGQLSGLTMQELSAIYASDRVVMSRRVSSRSAKTCPNCGESNGVSQHKCTNCGEIFGSM